MKIHLERSGGFAGMTSSTTVDTKALAANDADELQNLIHKSNIFERPARSAQQPKSQQPSPSPETKTKAKTKRGAADYFTYKITIQNGNKEQSLECNDINMQAEVKGLVDFVTKHGQK